MFGSLGTFQLTNLISNVKDYLSLNQCQWLSENILCGCYVFFNLSNVDKSYRTSEKKEINGLYRIAKNTLPRLRTG